MHAVGEFIGCQRTLEGDLCLMIAIGDDPSDLEKLQKLEGEKVSLDLTKFSEKRSLNANAYFWKLCDLIAKKLGSDKDTIYLMMLKDAGVFDQIDVIDKAVDQIKEFYRYVEEDHRYPSLILNTDGEEEEITMVDLKCYKGSHSYTKAEMADLINYTASCANDLGIDTWAKEEIDNLIERWDSR